MIDNNTEARKQAAMEKQMRKLVLSINVSLDGFADHTVMIADDELHEFFSGLLDNTDIALFGRVTYQLMESYWPRAHEDPKATKSMLDFADRFNAIPKIVFSKTLERSEWNKTRLVKRDVPEEIQKLKQLPGKDIVIFGSSDLTVRLIPYNVIDEYRIMVNPVVLGRGNPLFYGVSDKLNLKLINVRTFRSGNVLLYYQPERDKGK